MKNPTHSALLVIDMEYGFLDADSAHCIAMARGTIPACEKAVVTAREKDIPVFFITRNYRADGSDVECTRYESWKRSGKSMTPGSHGAQSPEGLCPRDSDYAIIKPRWSAFFGTELDLILRRLGVRTVILIGTTTPNCIRTTCYDANSLDYNVVVLTDCTSSQTQEIQDANLADMARMGAVLMDSAAFANYAEETVPDLAAGIRDEIL
jgi:nicotinamidase-related amidase